MILKQGYIKLLILCSYIGISWKTVIRVLFIELYVIVPFSKCNHIKIMFIPNKTRLGVCWVTYMFIFALILYIILKKFVFVSFVQLYVVSVDSQMLVKISWLHLTLMYTFEFRYKNSVNYIFVKKSIILHKQHLCYLIHYTDLICSQ